MLSYTCKTAVKAVIYLASKFESGEKAGIIEIAECLNASGHTVGKMLQTLVKRDVIKSLKGPSGGFYIDAEQLQQPIINIVHAVDGDMVFKECGLGLSKCSSNHPCPIHDEYKLGRDMLEALFTNKKVTDLCNPLSRGLTHLF
ncbi:MAG: Rrf2 family transcriptional regulator [Ferruginibacter sp.]